MSMAEKLGRQPQDPFGGTHIKILFIADKKRLEELSYMRCYLNDVAFILSVPALAPPVAAEVLEYKTNSGFILFVAGYASLQVWPEVGKAVGDVYAPFHFRDADILYAARAVYEPTWWKLTDLSSSMRY